MKGKIAAACAATAMGLFGSVALAAPAHAAEGAAFCFYYPNGKPFSGGPTILQVATSAGWQFAASSFANDLGCASYVVYGTWTQLSIRGVAQYNVPDGAGGTAYEWYGVSDTGSPGAGAVILGDHVLTCIPITGVC